jgi:predicted ATPase
MVGREGAMKQLGHTLDRVLQDGHARTTLITGEAGMGKSRLVAEFRGTLDRSRVGFFQGGPATYARLRPLGLAADLLRNMLGLSETDPSQAQVAALQAYLDQLGLGDDGVLLCLCNVLGLAGEETTNQARLGRLDNAVLQRLAHGAVREVLLAEARHTPSVMVFEDLHWVDTASRDLLEYLIRSLDDVPLMLVLVSRDGERDKALEPLITAAEVQRYPPVDIKLNPLTSGEGRLLVDRLIAGSGDVAESLKRRILERSGGNPLYAEEIVRILVEQGGLVTESGSWQVTPRALELVERVPGTLNELIVARFDRLPNDLREALHMAAVIGPSFPASLVERLNGYRCKAITAKLGALEARGFLFSSPFGEEAGYAFRNRLVQEVVYGTLPRRDRQKLHEQVGWVIEGGADWPLDGRTEAIAYHYARSANVSTAVPYLIAAGEKAARWCAYESAIQHYRRALAHMPEGDNFYSEQLARVQIGLGQALKSVGEFREAAEIQEKAVKHLLRQGLAVDSISQTHILVQGLRDLAGGRLREESPHEAVAHHRAGLDPVGDEGAQNSR